MSDVERAERRWRKSMGNLRRLTNQHQRLQERSMAKLHEILLAVLDADAAFADYLEAKHREEPVVTQERRVE